MVSFGLHHPDDSTDFHMRPTMPNTEKEISQLSNASAPRLLFDGHTDMALFALAYNRDQMESAEQINQREEGMNDTHDRGRAANSLFEMRRARIAVCVSSLAARVDPQARPVLRVDLDFRTHRMAYANAQGQLAYYRELEREGRLKLIRTEDDLTHHWHRWQQSDHHDEPIGLIVAMECADPIVDPAQVESWWNDGLRTVMLAHFGKSQYAFGTGSSGPLTEAGCQLLKEFEQIGMILDVSHLSDPSFHEALDKFSGPVIASHTNCRALVPGDRQFDDQQIQRLIERDAVIGAVMDAWMLVPGWVLGESSPEHVRLSQVADHIDHVCQIAGNTRHAAIGSDMGGTNHMPKDLQTTSDLHRIATTLEERGYSSTDIDDIFSNNWLRFFQQWLPPS